MTEEERKEKKRLWQHLRSGGMREYYKEHRYCPDCGLMPVGSTYVGFNIPPDTNTVWCDCGWRGITDDLVSYGGKNEHS